MAYRIEDITAEFADRTTGKRSILCEISADTAADLPANTTMLEYIIGSRGVCIDTGDIYKIDSAGIWHKQPAENAWINTYTKTEIDTIIQSVIDGQLTRGDIFRGYQITANTDVNMLTDYGCYYCSDGTTAATLSNCPITTSGFIMLNFSNGNRVRLFMAISATIPRMYIQSRTGGTWRTIRQFAMLDEIQADENMLGYSWGRYTVSETDGSVISSTTRIGTPDYFEIPTGTNTIVYNPYFDGVTGETFYLFYDSAQTYNNNYIGWVSAGVPVKVPAGMKYYRLAFRKPNNSTIIVSDMIRCSRNYA